MSAHFHDTDKPNGVVSLLWNARDLDERSDSRPETPSSVMQVGNFKRAIGSRVIQIHSISILASLSVGVVAQACTIIIYLVPVRATVNLIGRERVWVMSACPGLIWVFFVGQYFTHPCLQTRN
jgi:hypothetical protein